MSQISADLKKEFERGLGLLETLRDEVKVKLHLASLEAKDEWNKLEPHLSDVSRAAENVTEASHAALNEAVDRLKSFHASLLKHAKS